LRREEKGREEMMDLSIFDQLFGFFDQYAEDNVISE
jgi:hypothetical protein